MNETLDTASDGRRHGRRHLTEKQVHEDLVKVRLEQLRERLNAEDISTGELIELQGLAEHIEPGDVQLLEAAGVPEFPELTCPECGEEVWDGPRGSKLAKCWNSEGHESGRPLAFDTMD